MTSIVCKRCRIAQPINKFVIDKSRSTGHHPFCQECKKKYLKDWRKNNLDKSKKNNKKSHLKQKYGLTIDEFMSMLLKQDGKCKICEGNLVDEFHTCIDHDHRTGAVRGILCRKCNTALGQFDDRLDLLEKAATYLKDALR